MIFRAAVHLYIDAFEQRSMLGQPPREAAELLQWRKSIQHHFCVACTALLHCLPPVLADTCCCTQHGGVCAEGWVAQGNRQALKKGVCCICCIYWFLQKQNKGTSGSSVDI
jgi:hypothetical protein